MHRVHLEIQGRVQGVGFRYFVLRRAQELQLNGWVQNRADGSVVAEAEGGRDDLARFVARLREGPAGARVDRLTESWSESPAAHSRFVIRNDAGAR
jgi:acylphosphatase